MTAAGEIEREAAGWGDDGLAGLSHIPGDCGTEDARHGVARRGGFRLQTYFLIEIFMFNYL